MKASKIAVVLSVGTLLAGIAGCASPATRPAVPSNALQVSSGNKVVSFTADQDGKAYLNDDTTNRVVYSTELKRGQVMRFDPSTGVVRIDGNTAPEGIPDPANQHSIYFTPAEKATKADATSESKSAAVPTVRVPIGIKVDVQPEQEPAVK